MPGFRGGYILFQTQVTWPYHSSAVQPQVVPQGAPGAIVPGVDIFETKDEVVYIFEVPGINTEQLEVEIEDNNIQVRAPMLNINPQEAFYRYQERPKGEVNRIITLTPDADPQDVNANVKNGLLELRFTKKTGDSKGKKIDVGMS